MIDVLFSESEAAGLQIAKSRSLLIGSADGPAGLAAPLSQPRPRPSAGVPGDAQEVVCLGLVLDIGDGWYARRIEALITAGRITVAEDAASQYARQIRLA